MTGPEPYLEVGIGRLSEEVEVNEKESLLFVAGIFRLGIYNPDFSSFTVI